MDPLTVLATIKATAATVKTAIGVGKELVSVAKELSDIMNGVAHLTQIAAQPKGWRKGGSAEARAIEAFAAKMEAEQIERDVKSQIVQVYGVRAWEQIQRDVVRIRKEMKIAAIERAEQIEYMIEVGFTIVLSMILLAMVVWAIWFAIHYNLV